MYALTRGPVKVRGKCKHLRSHHMLRCPLLLSLCLESGRWEKVGVRSSDGRSRGDRVQRNSLLFSEQNSFCTIDYHPISGALTFMVLAAALVTASFLMSPVIEDVFGNVFYTRQRKFSSNEDEKYFQCTARWTIQVLMLQTTLVILQGKS